MPDNFCKATVTPYLKLHPRTVELLREMGDGAPLSPEDIAAFKIPEQWLQPGEGERYVLYDVASSARDAGIENNGDGAYYIFYENGLGEFGTDLLEWLLLHSENEYCYVEGADTCSKMRPGEFGGFAIVLWKHVSHAVTSAHYSTGSWITDVLAKNGLKRED